MGLGVQREYFSSHLGAARIQDLSHKERRLMEKPRRQRKLMVELGVLSLTATTVTLVIFLCQILEIHLKKITQNNC